MRIKRDLLAAAPAALRRVTLGAVCWLAAALLLYRPDVPRPFDIADFPEYLTVLQSETEATGQFRALVEHYRAHGRTNLLDYGIITAKWSLFGRSSRLWQIAGFMQMTVMAALMFLVVRRLGASIGGAGLAATLVLCSQPATAAWLRYSIREAIAGSLFLAAVLVALNLNRARRLNLAVAVIGVLAAALLLLKEMLVATLPVLLLLAAAVREDGTIGIPRWTRVTLRLSAVLAVVGLVVLVPAFVVAVTAPPGAYARQFGENGIAVAGTFANYLAVMVPFSPAGTKLNIAVVMADLALMAGLALGWRLYLTNSRATVHARALLVVGLVTPLFCVIAYAPWNEFRLFYAIPFLLGPGIIVAFAFTGLQRTAPTYSRIGSLLWGIVVVYMGTESYAQARRFDASLRTAVGVVRVFDSSPSVDSLLYAVCPNASPHAWRRLGPMLAQYAIAEGHSMPPTRETSCGEALERSARPGKAVAIVVLSEGAGAVEHPTHVISHEAWRFDWQRARPVSDTIRADVMIARNDEATR